PDLCGLEHGGTALPDGRGPDNHNERFGTQLRCRRPARPSDGTRAIRRQFSPYRHYLSELLLRSGRDGVKEPDAWSTAALRHMALSDDTVPGRGRLRFGRERAMMIPTRQRHHRIPRRRLPARFDDKLIERLR